MWPSGAAIDEGLALVIPPIVVAGVWFLWLRIVLGAGGDNVMEFGVPFVGLGSAVRLWATGSDLYAAVAALGALGIAVAALVRSGWRHPLGIALILQLAFMLMLTRDVIGLERNGTRMTLPVLVLGLVMLVTPKATELLQRPDRASTTGAMASRASSPNPM